MDDNGLLKKFEIKCAVEIVKSDYMKSSLAVENYT